MRISDWSSDVCSSDLYGIVILSPTYLAKNWTIREFYTLLAKEIEEHKVILPVLYNVSVDELKQKDLLMADRFAVRADRGRSEGRRVGKECISTCKSRGSPKH